MQPLINFFRAVSLTTLLCCALSASAHDVLLRLNLFNKISDKQFALSNSLIDNELKGWKGSGRQLILLDAESIKELREKLDAVANTLPDDSRITHLYWGGHGDSGRLSTKLPPDSSLSLFIGNDSIVVSPLRNDEFKSLFAQISKKFAEHLHAHFYSCQILRGEKSEVHAKALALYDGLGVRDLTVFGHIRMANGNLSYPPAVYSLGHLDRVVKGSIILFPALAAIEAAILIPLSFSKGTFPSLASVAKLTATTATASVVIFLGFSVLFNLRYSREDLAQMGHQITIKDRELTGWLTLDAFDDFHYRFLNKSFSFL